jgi:hypothetical protein
VTPIGSASNSGATAAPTAAASAVARAALWVALAAGALLLTSVLLGGVSSSKSWDLHWFGALGFYVAPVAEGIALVAAIVRRDWRALKLSLVLLPLLALVYGFTLLIAIGSASAY